MVASDIFGNFFPGQDALCMGHQENQQFEFLRGQGNFFSVPEYAVGLLMDYQLMILNKIRLLFFFSAMMISSAARLLSGHTVP